MLQFDLFAPSIPTPAPAPVVGLPDIVRIIAEHSGRPRYTFMVLDLIARAARTNGEAGPLVREGEVLVPIREWLAAAIAPSGARHHQRRATADKVRLRSQPKENCRAIRWRPRAASTRNSASASAKPA